MNFVFKFDVFSVLNRTRSSSVCVFSFSLIYVGRCSVAAEKFTI